MAVLPQNSIGFPGSVDRRPGGSGPRRARIIAPRQETVDEDGATAKAYCSTIFQPRTSGKSFAISITTRPGSAVPAKAGSRTASRAESRSASSGKELPNSGPQQGRSGWLIGFGSEIDKFGSEINELWMV